MVWPPPQNWDAAIREDFPTGCSGGQLTFTVGAVWVQDCAIHIDGEVYNIAGSDIEIDGSYTVIDRACGESLRILTSLLTGNGITTDDLSAAASCIAAGTAGTVIGFFTEDYNEDFFDGQTIDLAALRNVVHGKTIPGTATTFDELDATHFLYQYEFELQDIGETVAGSTTTTADATYTKDTVAVSVNAGETTSDLGAPGIEVQDFSYVLTAGSGTRVKIWIAVQ